ncbi:MAG: site-2 protease family protein [Thermodesulfobacteriota bacterium]
MKWSTKLGSFKGIEVYIHFTFWLIFLWVGYIYWMRFQNISSVVEGVLLVIAVFGCVLLHEFGHALTAQKYGIKTRDITLLPIGGLAKIEKIPEKPIQEFWITLAGPAVNVVIAILLFLILYLSGNFEPLTNTSITEGSFIEKLMLVNVVLVVFNVLPAFPMDGGRILRAVLAMRMDYTKATQVAVSIGQGMAFLFGFIGLFTNPFLVIIALFVWIGATMEGSIVQLKSLLGGIPVKDAMITDFKTLSANDELSKAVELVISGSQKDFPVMKDHEVIGILTQRDLLKGLSERGQSSLVSDTMTTNFKTIGDSDLLDSAFFQFEGSDCKTIPVIKFGKLIGILTLDNIGEFVSIKGALEVRKE